MKAKTSRAISHLLRCQGACCVPYDDADERNDIAARLTSRREKHNHHRHRGEDGLAESLMLVLPESQIRDEEHHNCRYENPQVAISRAAADTAEESQCGDVLGNGCEILTVFLRQTGVPFLVLADHVVGTGYQHRRHEHDDCPEGQ